MFNNKRRQRNNKNDLKKQKDGFLERLLDTLGYSLLGNILTVKDTIRGGECTTTADQDI